MVSDLLYGLDLVTSWITKYASLYTTASCRGMSSFHLVHPRYCAGDLASWCWWMMLTGNSGVASRHCIRVLPAVQIAVFSMLKPALQCTATQSLKVQSCTYLTQLSTHCWASSECSVCTRVKLDCCWMQWHVRYNSWRRRYHCFHINITRGLRLPNLLLSHETHTAISA